MTDQPSDKSGQSERRSKLGSFTWDSKQDLYEYFNGMYGISGDEVDVEIERVLESFRVRQGTPIDTQELWQKVGADLERRLSQEDMPTQVIPIRDLRLRPRDESAHT